MYWFLLQLFAAEAMLVFSLKRRKKFIIRLICGIAALVLVQFGYDALMNAVFENLPKFFYMLTFMLTLAMSAGIIYLSFDCTVWKAILSGTGGYAIQNCVYYTLILISTVFGFSYGKMTPYNILNEFIRLLFFFVLYIPFFLVIFFHERKNSVNEIGNLTTVIVSVVIVLITIILSSFMKFGKDYIITYLYSIACGILLFAIQMGLFEISAAKIENQTITQLLKKEWYQYQLSKQNIEIINLKCHDLKHQINTLLSVDNGKEREKMLADVNKAIDIYDSITHTGNETLDIILTEKRLICEDDKIMMACIADGEAIDFMSPMDISSLFGNALDNAIESVKIQSDIEKRFINLNVSRQNNLIIIHIENYCSENIEFDGDLPVTSKEDKSSHGFGTKSIKFIVDKYGGNMLMSVSEGLFTLDILFSQTKINSNKKASG